MEKYTRTKSIHPCRLNKADLIELVNLIKTDFPQQKRKEDFKITAHFYGFNVFENNLEEFLQHKNLPKIFSNISFRLIGWSVAGDIDKSLELTFYDSFITLNVDGDSESWVRGKYTQMLDFLKTKSLRENLKYNR